MIVIGVNVTPIIVTLWYDHGYDSNWLQEDYTTINDSNAIGNW